MYYFFIYVVFINLLNYLYKIVVVVIIIIIIVVVVVVVVAIIIIIIIIVIIIIIIIINCFIKKPADACGNVCKLFQSHTQHFTKRYRQVKEGEPLGLIVEGGK